MRRQVVKKVSKRTHRADKNNRAMKKRNIIKQ